MIQHQVYQCPKCFNTLLVSNKMLHDLRCTYENPATYENIMRQSQQMSTDNNQMNSSSNFSGRMSITNEDGTSIDIVREKSIRGKDELIEIKYDPQGNVISRKKADYYIPKNDYNSFHELNDYNENNNNVESSYDNNNSTYYEVNKEVEVRNTPSVIYETAEPEEIVIEAPAKYDPHVTINKPIEETVIHSHAGLTDGMLDNIIRNTMNQNNNTGNNYNTHSNINLNGYDFSSQNYSATNNNNINTNNSNVNYNMNNINNHSNFGNNDTYNYNSSFQTNSYKNNDDIFKNNGGMGSNNFNSYDYHY